MAKNGGIVVPEFRDILGNQVVVDDLAVVAMTRASIAGLWLGQVKEIKRFERIWGNQVSQYFKVRVQPIHPGAYSSHYPHHSWDIDTNIMTGEREYVGLPRPVVVESDRLVRYLRGLAPILDDNDWSQRHVVGLP